MYNRPMTNKAFQIRICDTCGLRYPLIDGNAFGTRCPICMGDTRLVLSRELILEPTRNPITDLTASTGSAHRPNPSPTRAERSGSEDEAASRGLTVLLDNIRSAWNVGSILRSADGFGFTHAYLCGITPTPDGPAREAVTKTSLGAEDSVTWSYHKDAVKLIHRLKKEGWKIWVLEESERATSISQAPSLNPDEHAVLIAGSEVTGVDPELLDLSDEIYYIPMRGEKKSFNVAMAFSIAAYALSNHDI